MEEMPPQLTQAFDDAQRRMDGFEAKLAKDLRGLRSGRASPSLLEPVRVLAHGATMPLEHVSSVTLGGSQMLVVQVWDPGLVPAVNKAIREAGLDLSPQIEGNTLRMTVPSMSEERRKEIQRTAGKYAEQARVAVRSVRRDLVALIRKEQKDGGVSEDASRRYQDELQKRTDKAIAHIDALLDTKDRELQS